MEQEQAPVIQAAEESAAVPHAQLVVGTSTEIDARLAAHMKIHDSGGAAGSPVELNGWLILSGVQARLRMRPPGNGSDATSRERTKLIPLVAAGRTVPAMPGPNSWNVPSDSKLALRACDFAEHPLAPERDVGACREGSSEAEIPVQLAVRLAVRLDVRLDTRARPDRHGLVLGAKGDLTILNGVLIRLTYWSASGAGGSSQRGTIEWPVVAPDRKLHGTVRELIGVTPGTWLMIRFLDGRGGAIDEERVVGRCAMR